MAGKPEKHGSGYRVRWTNRLEPAGTPGRRPQYNELANVKDAKLFVAWLEEDGREFVTYPDDPRIVSGAWRASIVPGGAAAHGQTFIEYAEAAIDRARVTENTKANRRRHLLKFPEWRGLRLPQIDRDVLEAKIDAFDRDPSIAATSAKTYLDFAHGLLHRAYLSRLMPINPFRQDNYGHPLKVDFKKAGRAMVRKRGVSSIFLTPETIRAMIAAAIEQETALMIRTGVGTGLRISELFAVRKRSVHLGPLSLTVDKAILRDPEGTHRYYVGVPKLWSIRDVPLHQELAAELSVHMQGLGDDDFLFPAPRGGFWAYENFSYRWRRVIARAHERGLLDPRIDPSPHALRHTFASRAYDRGLTSFQVSRFMGHQNERTCEAYYGHLAGDGGSASAMRDAQAAFAEMDRDAVSA